MYSNTLSFLSSRNVSNQVSHPYKTTGKIIVLGMVSALWRRKILLLLPDPCPSHILVGIAITVPSHLDFYSWAHMYLVTKEQLFAHGPVQTNVI